MNDSDDTASPTIPKPLAAACWLGAALTVAGALVAAFSGYPLLAPILLLPGVLIIMRSALKANTNMRNPNASGEYHREADRLLLAVFGPALALGVLMVAIAIIAQLMHIVNLF